MKELDKVNYFGVRHLSPAAAWHLLSFLNEIRPELILIEGFSDADHTIPYLTDSSLIPPVALLAYSKMAPVRTLMYPLAGYSPEYQALCWSKKNNKTAKFIDLPSGVFMGLNDQYFEGGKESNFTDIYRDLTASSGENDFDSYWERSFEHITEKDSFRKTVLELGKTMRLLEKNDKDFHRAENLVREAYMRRRICEEIARGADPEKIVVIAGAYHIPSFKSSEHIMSDQEIELLPRIDCSLTLMPYSFSKLSSQSGYGAGNLAPAYFQLVWESLKEKKLSGLPSLYLSLLSRLLEERGLKKSSAHIIEAVRLAQALASMKEAKYPVLSDVRDAAITVLGEGNDNVLYESMKQLEVGTAFGVLPKNTLKTSVQDDFNRNMKELNLERFRQNCDQYLKLDLRENLNAKFSRSAFLSLRRSIFLHRLHFLAIPFGQVNSEKDWQENWQLNWQPESEVSLAETVLLGETIELAASAKLGAKLKVCFEVSQAADLLKSACLCGLTGELVKAQQILQNLAAESTSIFDISETCLELSELINFGSVRKLNTKDFIPLLIELFNEASLQIVAASNCDDEAAKNVFKALDYLDQVSLSSSKTVNSKLYIDELQSLSYRDDLNPSLSGYATSLLLEKNIISEIELSNEFCRRISPGIDPDLGAGWFEGLAKRNRSFLVKRKEIWKEMSSYIASLSEEQFKRALVFLRRTFSEFASSEIQQIAKEVCTILGADKGVFEEMDKLELNDNELSMLEDLDF